MYLNALESQRFLYCYSCVLKCLFCSWMFATLPFKREQWPHCKNFTFSTCILKWKGVFYFQIYLASSYLKENTHFRMITFVHIVFWKTLCPFGEHWLLHCYYMTRRICGIKQVIIVAFCCWLPIMFTLFPSLAITSFLHFSYWGITFTQCATKCLGINYCYYKHQSSSLLLLTLFFI